MRNTAIAGWTVKHNKLHLDRAGINSTGRPKCGQGRIVDWEYQEGDVLSMQNAVNKLLKVLENVDAEFCSKCFNGLRA
jgi:hypothetical protein